MRRTHLERNILFLAEDNGCLSLMAEAMAKHMSPPKARVFSAGLKSGRIPLEVRRVLEEIGVTLTSVSPKNVNEVPLNEIDLVISFNNAHAKCATLPSTAKIEKWPVPNPAQAGGGSSAILSVYRQGRDEIDRRLAALFLDHWRHVV
jgi:protein-tyrosine-phosphatase